MTINTTWTDPSDAGTLDLDTDDQLTETVWDALVSNIKRLGGTAGLLQCTDAGLLLLNDTANAKSTIGLTINQGGADNEIVSLKSSDVVHGVTDVTETDTWGKVEKSHATGGGIHITGAKGAGTAAAADLVGVSTEAPSTAAATSARGLVELKGFEASGASLADATANAIILAVRTRRGGNEETIFTVDEDGDIGYDGSAAAYDEHDDALAARDLSYLLSSDKSHRERIVRYQPEALQAMGLVNLGEDARPFVKRKNMDMLMLGAIGQIYERMNDFERRLVDTKGA